MVMPNPPQLFSAGMDVSSTSVAIWYPGYQEKIRVAWEGDPRNLQKVFLSLAPALPKIPRKTEVFLDWSPGEAYWGNRAALQRKSLVVGFLIGFLISAGCSAIMAPPGMIRRCLNLKQNAKKEVVWKTFEELYQLPQEKDPDIHDAKILAILGPHVLRETLHESRVRGK